MPDPHDPIDWIKHLEGPEPPSQAPDWNVAPRASSWANRSVMGAGFALAAACLLWVALPSDDGVRLRGHEGGVDVDLRIVSLTDGVPERIHRGGVYPVGQQLAFRLGAMPATRIFVWASGPTGELQLGEYDSSPTPVDLMDDNGLVALVLARPGVWTVYASASGPGNCPPNACVSRTITVGEGSK